MSLLEIHSHSARSSNRLSDGGFATGRGSKSIVSAEGGIWIFILGDVTAFGGLLANYLYYCGRQQDLFEQSQGKLNLHFGTANTVILLLSSLFVVLAVRRLHTGLLRQARFLIGGAFCCGLAFSMLKAIEYYDKVSHQLTPVTNAFFAYYFILTGLHLIHVLIGLGVLAFMFRMARKGCLSPNDLINANSGACYWHMVDLIWILVFPLLYLVR